MTSYNEMKSAVNTVAFQLGSADASMNEPCVPESIFVRRCDQVAYATGYESVSGPTFATAQFTGSKVAEPHPEGSRAPTKQHNWGDYNAKRSMERIAAHQRKVEAAYEMTAEFLGGVLEGDIIFMA